jgi:hypothetical protein
MKSLNQMFQAIFGPPPNEDTNDANSDLENLIPSSQAPPVSTFTGLTMPAPTPPTIPGMPTLPSLTTPISLPGMPPITVSCALPPSALQGVSQNSSPAQGLASATPLLPQSPDNSSQTVGVNPYRLNNQQSSAAGL